MIRPAEQRHDLPVKFAAGHRSPLFKIRIALRHLLQKIVTDDAISDRALDESQSAA